MVDAGTRPKINFRDKVLVCAGLIFVWEAFPYNFFIALQRGSSVSVSAGQVDNIYFWFLVCAAVSLALLVLFHMKIERLFERRSFVVVIAGVVETLCFVLIYLRPSLTVVSALVLWFCVACAAVGASLLLAAWGFRLSKFSVKEARTLILASFAACSILKLAESAVSSGFLSFDMFAIPFCSGVCFFASMRSSVGTISTVPVSFASAKRNVPWKEIIIIALLVYLNEPLMAFLTPVQMSVFDESTKPIVGIVGVVFATFLLLFQYRGESRFANRKLWVFLGMAFLFVYAIVILFNDPYQGVSAASVVIFRKCLVVFCWMLACSLTAATGLSAVLVFSLVNLVFYVLSYLLRLAFVMLYEIFPIPAFFNVETVALGGLVIVACAAIVMMGAQANFAPLVGMPSPHETGADPRDGACVRIAEQRVLTKREAEVLRLLAKGYTMPGVSEELSISLNTVRSHAKSIYQKMKISSRQELIKAVEKEATGGGGC